MRGGNLQRLTLNTAVAEQVPTGDDETLQVHELPEALTVNLPTLEKVAEMRHLLGHRKAEIAEKLEVDERSVRHHSAKARLLLGQVSSAEPGQLRTGDKTRCPVRCCKSV